MRYVDEYRDGAGVAALVARIREAARGDFTLMEVCGGQTHAILKFGLDALLPRSVHLVHGPGCPVCVTGRELIDKAVAIASRPEVTFCSFGDMLRVPGSRQDLLSVRARGGDVRVVHSPLDALRIARQRPERKVVFFGVGFETTAPANALAVHHAAALGLPNFFLLCAQVLVPPALEALLAGPQARVQAFLAPGHVCAVAGTASYAAFVARHRVPVVVTGFEPLDILEGVLLAVRQLERGEARLENAYARAVRSEGNPEAQRMLDEVFVIEDRCWRGLGNIPRSGYGLAPRYARFDAERAFDVAGLAAAEPEDCRSGLVLQGRLEPTACPEFGRRCTPEHPLGATMVSAEGACAAYFHYRRTEPVGSRP